MWKRVSNGDSIKPSELDTTSSAKWNYVRRNFESIEESEEIPEHWEYDENKILKTVWETYEHVIEHDSALDDVYAALTELADMIVEVG